MNALPARTAPDPTPLPRTVPTIVVGRVAIDAHLHGHLTPEHLEHWRRFGFRVLRVGRAAYLSSPDRRHRWVVGVWSHTDRPAWADRLDARHRWLIGRGAAPAPELRSELEWLARRRRARLRSPITGRFLPGPIPWYWPCDERGWPVGLLSRDRQPWRLS